MRVEDVLKAAKPEATIDIAIGMIAASIESIHDAESVYPASEST